MECTQEDHDLWWCGRVKRLGRPRPRTAGCHSHAVRRGTQGLALRQSWGRAVLVGGSKGRGGDTKFAFPVAPPP